MEGHAEEARRAAVPGPAAERAGTEAGGVDAKANGVDTETAPEDARGSYAQALLLGQGGRATIPLGLLLAAGIFLGLRDGSVGLEPIFLIVGSVVSAVAMLLYALPSVLVAYGRAPRPWMAAAALAGLVPYIFGVAVIFGIGMIRPLVVFSLAGAAEAVFFLLIGFWFLRDYSLMAALGARIDEVMEA